MAKSNCRITLDKSQPLYVGIDVHKNSWSICLLHCGEIVGRFTLKGEFELLKKLLQKYEGMAIYSVYEAGFSGFHLHFELEKIGVRNIKKAIVAVARKLICRIYAMVKTGKEYEVRAAA